jgi:hypothetical protein
MPDLPPTSFIGTLTKKQKRGVAATGLTGVAVLGLIVNAAVEHGSDIIKACQGAADGNVGSDIYYRDKRELQSNLVEILIQQREEKCTCAKH